MTIAPLIAVVTRRLQLQLRSVTWWGASVLMFAVFAAAAYRSVPLFDMDRATFESDQARHADEASGLPQTYSRLSLSIDREPAPLRLLLRGSEDAFAASVTTYGRFRPTAFRGRDTRSSYESSLFLVDPAMVLGLLGSLLAIVLASSTVVREREEGTLQLTLTYPCRRSTILFGEHLATLLIVATPMLGCTLVFLAFAAVSERLRLDGPVLLQVAQFLGLCILLASAFSGLGLLVATTVRRPTTAITIAFALWVFLVFAYPIVLPSIAALVRPVEPSASSLAAADTLAEYDLVRRANDVSTSAAEQDELRGHLAQADLHDSLALVSPYSVFIIGVETATGTGTAACRAFLQTVQTAASQFRRWQDGMLSRYPDRATWYDPANPPLDLTGLPPNQTERSGLSGRSAPAALILLVWNALFIVVTQVQFARYDARP
ncbi:MAG TPA: ABC transporter permease [Thermoanaerobaculia bacterium]|jgi:ABC-type transport system involved in multi-copper enzyme maturation permease subunit|nr:ABC transporter permease [Thermoanaerobaculia bacterium]